MPNKYLNSFEIAARNYAAQTERPGYKPGWFTWLRHKTKNNPAIKILGEALQKCDSDEGAKKIIELYFQKYTGFNNHSVASYLLDELLKNFSDENWRQYQPKPLVFFQGIVYRGTLVPPSVIFKDGFIDRSPSQNLDDYVSDCNGSVGVSTTTSFSMAKGYALPLVTAKNVDSVDIQPYGYIYEINCRSLSAINIAETQSKRGNKFRAMLARGKAEVNVIGDIKSCDVMKAWKVYRNTNTPIEIYNNVSYVDNNERKQDSEVHHILVPHRDFNPAKNDKEKSADPSSQPKNTPK